MKNNSSSSSYLYNIDLDTQERVSKLQKLKEHLEETKGPEAWYHLFQTLIQHQQQDHSALDSESSGVSPSSNDDDNFKDHLLALEQQWIADRQKSSTTTTPTTTISTTRKSKTTTRKSTTLSTRRMKINQEENSRVQQRPSIVPDEELTEEEEDEGGDDSDRYYWQPTYDDQRTNRYNYPRKTKGYTTISTTTTRRSRTRYPSNNRESSIPTILRGSSVLLISLLFVHLWSCALYWLNV